MPAEQPSDVKFEIGHVLFIDIVGYSKLLIEEQRERLRQLTEIVLATEQVRESSDEQLVRLPTGDGMALVFHRRAEEPARCALEIAEALTAHPQVLVRMGIHSGPVSGVTDVSGRSNIAGAGINMAQRVMDCGDAGHILLSRHVAEDLEHYGHWQPLLHDLGECEVKHGARLGIVNLYRDGVGNPTLPKKLQALQQRRARARWTGIAAVLLLLAATLGASLFILRKPSRSASPAPDKSIAVLPFENLSSDKENAYFADGIQDELLSNLAKIKDLKVISRTSVMQYKTGITRNLREIAQQLGVSNVVEGSVRRSGNHLRVSVQLIDALIDRHIWAQNYDRTLADSLALQGELATEIATGVGATLSPQEKARVEATPTKNTAAYDAYLRGRALAGGLRADRSNVESAAQSFQEAVKLDPNFVLAWAHLSWVQSGIYWFGTDPTPSRLAAAKDALDHAVALDPSLPETHLALGYYRYYGLRDFSGALAEFQLAEKSLPNDVDVLKAIGLIQRRFAHWDEAIAVMSRAVELDPRNLEAACMLAVTYMGKRRYSDALTMADHILAVEPSNTHAIELKVLCFWGLGNLEAVDLVLASPGAPMYLRAHQALNKHHATEAVDMFTKELKNAEGDENRSTGVVNWENELLLDLGLAQQRAGNVAASKAAYQQAVQGLTQALNDMAKADTSVEPGLHSLLGVAYAGLGDAASAVAEGKKGMALQPTSQDPLEGPEREEQMSQIYASLGNADGAIPILKRWIHVPSSTSITPTLLRIDPVWDPIRSDPRFQKLCEENPK